MDRLLREARSIASALMWGFVAALLLWLWPPTVAVAQEVGNPAAGLDPVLGLIGRGMVAATIVSAVLLFLRAWSAWLAGDTARAKLACQVLALLLGVGTGLVGVVPPVAPGWVGRVLAGVLVGALATFGRDAVSRGWRALPVAEPQPAAEGAPLVPRLPRSVIARIRRRQP